MLVTNLAFSLPPNYRQSILTGSIATVVDNAFIKDGRWQTTLENT